MLYRSCSQNWRSERIVYKAISRLALSRCSGGIEGRPPAALTSSNSGDMRPNAESTSGLICRSGWFFGTNPSGFKPNSNVACRSVSPLIAVSLSYNNTHTSMISHVLFQQPASRRLVLYKPLEALH